MKEMTVRELIQSLILESPDLDAEVYVEQPIDEIEAQAYKIHKITSDGSNDSLFIKIGGR